MKRRSGATLDIAYGLSTVAAVLCIAVVVVTMGGGGLAAVFALAMPWLALLAAWSASGVGIGVALGYGAIDVLSFLLSLAAYFAVEMGLGERSELACWWVLPLVWYWLRAIVFVGVVDARKACPEAGFVALALSAGLGVSLQLCPLLLALLWEWYVDWDDLLFFAAWGLSLALYPAVPLQSLILAPSVERKLAERRRGREP